MSMAFGRKATIGERIAAFVIDSIIIWILSLIVFMNFRWIFPQLGYNSNYLTGIMMLMYIFKDIFFGRSIGKLILKIAVRDFKDPDKRVNLLRLILRNIFIIFQLIELIFLLLNQNIRIGDALSKTVVVKLEPKNQLSEKRKDDYLIETAEIYPKIVKRAKKTAAIVTAIVLSFVLLLLTLVTVLLKGNGPYRQAIERIENSHEVRLLAGDIKGYGFIPNGQVNITNGHGKSSLIIKVKGESQNIRVLVFSSKEPDGEWVIDKFEIVE